MRNLSLCFICFFITAAADAQWSPVNVNYKHVQHPDFFIPLSMHFSDNANGYILNSNALWKLKENRWQPVNTGPVDSFSYTNLFTVDPQNTFLCGWDGKVSKFNGDSLQVLFTLDPSEVVNTTLNTIFMTDSVHGWAAGEGGTLVKIDGNTHIMMNQLPEYSFKDIYFDGPDHGWMIGYSSENVEEGGVIFEYTDGTWLLHSTVPGQAYDIEFSSPGHGFITGQLDIYRYNSSTNQWVAENIPGYHLQYHLSMLNDDYGIGVSDNNQQLQYLNGVWSPAPSSQVNDMVNIKVLADGNAWAISQAGNNDPNDLNDGKVQWLENNIWSTHSLRYLDTLQILPLGITVTSLYAVDKKNWFINGQHLQLPDDKNWPDSIPVLGSDTFCTVSRMFSNNFGLGLNGNLLEWNGVSWNNKNIDAILNPDTSISNVCMHVFADTSGFICRQLFAWSSGEIKNVIVNYDYPSNSLTQVATLDSRSPFAIHFSDRQHGWVAGDEGLLVQYVNGNWNTLAPVTNKRLTSVFTVDSSLAWAAGDEGTLLKYNGHEWEKEHLPTQQNLHNVYFTNRNNGWVVGDSGLIFHYNGHDWLLDSSHNNLSFYAVCMADSAFGFTGGDNGTLLQFVKPVPPPPPAQKFCEYGNTWYAFHLEGGHYDYQWQVDIGDGNGFTNIVNDNVFTGTTTDTLWINNVPPAFYGYQFRCIASHQGQDSTSTTEELRFVNQWTGAVSHAWEDAGNWSCGSIPGENTDVIIINGEIILSTQASIRSLKLSPGVNITVADGAALHILK